MNEIEKTILKMLGTKENQNKYHIYKIKQEWKNLIGNSPADNCYPVKIERRVLFLNVNNSVWANQLMMLKNTIIKRVNECVGCEAIKDVRFTIVSKNIKKSNFTEQKEIKIKQEEYESLSSEELANIKNSLNDIEDEKLREKFFQVKVKQEQRKKYLEKKKNKKCKICGTFLFEDEDETCLNCLREEKEEIKGEIFNFLKKEPWINFKALQKKFKCDKMLYDVVKENMKAYYFEKIKYKECSKEEQDYAVSLKLEKPLEEVTATEYENVLKHLRKK